MFCPVLKQIDGLKLNGQAALNQKSGAEAVNQPKKVLRIHSGQMQGKQRSGCLNPNQVQKISAAAFLYVNVLEWVA